MPTLHVLGADGRERAIALSRRITTLGSGPESDVLLADASLPGTALHIHFDGRDFNAACHGGAELHLNGKRKLSARLSDGDRLRLGTTELRFTLRDLAASAPAPERGLLEAMEGLVRFSERLLAASDLPRLLDELLDALLEATHAEKGFLILLEEGRMVVKAARNLARERIAGAVGRASDSIVQRVMESRRPVIVADALHDAHWSSSSSVVNLKLCSVLCAPLLRQGESLGVIYLGNDSVVSLFERRDLEVLTVFASQASLLVQNALLLQGLRQENEELRESVERQRFGELVGSGPSMGEVFRRIERVAPTEVAVLVTGEPGTGKALVAREIHRRSARAAAPFAVLSCAAAPPELLEAELFGTSRGASAGREGKLLAARGGTLLLEAVSELTPELQARLQRALQEGVPGRPGGAAGEPLDVRLVSTTQEDLGEAVRSGRFRADLHDALDGVTIALPSLAQRGDDVLVLARFFLTRYARELGSRARHFTPEALAALRHHAWAGNIRELESRVRKAVVLCEGMLVSPGDLELGPESKAPVVPLAEAKEAFQRRYIDEVLARNGGNRTRTARDLDVDPRTIFRHLEKLDRGGTQHLDPGEAQEKP